MPHKDEIKYRCDIGQDGNIRYETNSPAETLGSEAMGVPAKGGSPWTDQAPGSSSAMKPSKLRQQPQRQMPKRSFLDTSSNNDPVNDYQDDQMQFLRNSAPVVSAPFDNVHPDKSVTCPTFGDDEADESTIIAPRSGQNAFLSMTDDGEDDSTFAADKSPTPKPSRLALSRKRTMSDASDLPAPTQLKQVTSSRQREMSDMSETPIVDERPKKKGILHFSSAAPSMADAVDEDPPQNIPDSTKNKSGLPSHPASHAKKTLANQRRSDLKSNAKVKLSALDLEVQEGMMEEQVDPFDQANIPPSRGLSPGPSMRKPKQAPKKQAAEKPSQVLSAQKKPSPTGKKPAAASSKVSTRKKQAARPRQKAKPSAAKPVESSTAFVHGEDNGNEGDPTSKLARSSVNRVQAKAKQTTAAASNLMQSAKASGKYHSGPQKDAVSISSASESGSLDTDESDDDEYVDKSRANAVHGNSEPPKTRNTTAIYKSRNESASTTESSVDVKIKEQDHKNHDQVQDEGGVALECLTDKSTVDAVAPDSDQNTEVIVGQQPKEKATDTHSKLPSHLEANAACEQQSPSKDQNGPDEIEMESLAAEVVTQPLKKVRTTHPTKAMSSVQAVDNHFQSGRPRTRLTRRSHANQSENDSTPSNLKAAQSGEQAKRNHGLVDPSPLVSQGKLSQRAVDTKPKDRKANIISFRADGSRNNGNPRHGGSATNNQSGEPDSVVTDSRSSQATKAAQRNAEGSSRACTSGASRYEPAGLSVTPLARRLQTEQSSSLVKDQPHAKSPAVDDTLPSEDRNLHGSHISQMHTHMVAKEPQVIVREADDHKILSPTQAINGEHPVPRQIKTNGDLPIGDQDHTNDMADLEFASGTDDRLDGPTIPDSLEQPDDIENIASASQLEDSAQIANLIALNLEGGVNNRKRPFAYECATQTLVPDSEQPESHSPVDDEEHVPNYQTERQTLNSLQPPRYLPKSQSAKIQKLTVDQVPVSKKQPVGEKHSTMSQHHVSAKTHMATEGKEMNHMSRDSEAQPHRKTTRPKQQMLKTETQSGAGKEPGKSYLQDLSTNLQRPFKKSKLDLPRPTAASPVADVNPQFCVPAHSFSSDDVFAPIEGKEERVTDYGIINQLRGIESEKGFSEPEMETHGPTDSHIEKGHGPPHQRPSKRLALSATHPRSVQNTTHGKFRDQNADNISGSDLWRRGLTNRYQGMVPLVQHEEQLAAEDPKLDQTIEDSMHQIVAVSLFPMKYFVATTDTSLARSTGFAFEGNSNP